ncbi:M3 family oligoendopeptidase [Novosphingobium colocasiae]|uniref:M3 family oligoendopeptidase n=1 Tax=Novosphingobium colocasiae TaxID=1256513 RepID=UPI0035B3FD58
MPEADRRGVLMGLAASLPAAGLIATPGFAAVAAGSAAPPASGAAWDLTDLFADTAAWEAGRKAVTDALPRLAGYKGTLGESAVAMLRALDDISAVTLKLVRVYIYASLKADEDLRISANQERDAQATDLYAAFQQAVAWQAPEVLALGRDKVEGFIAASPDLARRFAFSLRDTLRQAEHTLSPEGEDLLAAASSPLSGPAATRGQLVSSDLPWPTVTLSDGRKQRLDEQGYTLVRDAPARADRKLVFDTFWGAYKGFENTLGANYAALLKGDLFEARARKYPGCLAAAIDRNAVPEGVYRTLVAEVNAGLPQLHRYFRVRQRMLKLPDLRYYDVYVPLVSLDRKYSLTDMRTITLEALKPLGPEYQAMLAKATSARWMDPLPRPGKRSGAYMSGDAYDVHPYLLLNLGEDYSGLSTYAHEWGHAMHTLLVHTAQPFELADYPIFTAEIASTCNEMLLGEYLLSRAKSRDEQIFLLGMQLDRIRGTFFRQTLLAEFELKAHEMAEAGEGLSGEAFSRVYLDLLRRYHGPDFVVDDLYGVEWAYIPHFFNAFYVYQYATSIAAGTWFGRRVLDGGKAEREGYLNVLRAGGSDHPTEILKRAGLDMTTPTAYQGLVAEFGRILDRIEALLG